MISCLDTSLVAVFGLQCSWNLIYSVLSMLFNNIVNHELNAPCEGVLILAKEGARLKEWNMFQIFSCHLISICF